MAFPSASGADDLSSAWTALRQVAASIRREAQTLNDQSAAGDVEALRVAQYCESLSNSRDLLVRYAGTPGLAAYVREQLDNPAIDIAAEYVAMRDQVDAVRAWITANFPKDGSNFLRVVQFTAQAKLARFTLTSVQTAGLRTQLASLIATIA